MTYNKKIYDVKPYHNDEIRLDEEFKDVKGPMSPRNRNKVDEKLERPIAFSHIGKTVGEGGNGGIFKSFKTAINQGASKVELSIGSTNLGSASGIGYHGPKKKKAIKEMSIASNVKINSVHTPPTGGEAVPNLSGLGKNGISKENIEKSKETVKRTIDFAYDVTSDNEDQIPEEGISVVVHTGEFPRSMREVNKRYGEDKFNVEEKPKHFFVNTKTEEIKPISEDQDITIRTDHLEKLRKIKEGKTDIEGGIKHLKKFTDLYDILNKTKEEKKEDVNGFTKFNWKDIENVSNELTNKLKQDKNNPLNEIFLNDEDNNIDEKKVTPTETFIKLKYLFDGLLETQSNFARSDRIKKEVKSEREQLEEMYKKDHVSKKRYENKLELLESKMREAEMTEIQSDMRMKEMEEQMSDFKDIEKVAKKNTVDSYVELAEHIYDRQKQEGTDKNVYLAPENIFPEQGYGSHPNELIELVKESREKFKKKLIEKEGLSEKAAKKIAEDKIKATFDTQHLALWGKHFKGSEEEFWDWYDEKVEEMSKEGIIGNVHMVDGDRYSHGHQPIGHGKIPIRKAMSKIKKYYEKNGLALPAMNSEGWDTPGKPGSGEQLASAWRELSHFKDSYIPHKNRNVNFSEIEDSYFMGKKSPYFVYGNNAPSKLFTSWSGLPLE
ncbi:MAG: hypothetical protein ACOCRX_00385 [Candidatus Woesearchaeota archaeon]